MTIEAAKLTIYRERYRPQIRTWVNVAISKPHRDFYDTIPRFLELAGKLGITVASDKTHLDDLHCFILAREARVERDHRSCASSVAERFQAAFDVIGEILTGWQELRQDLSRLNERQLAGVVQGVYRQFERIDNPNFFGESAALPDQALEEIGNILIRASLNT